MSKYRRTFESLTIMGKRARIAADVLAQIEAKKILVRSGTFLGLFSEYYGLEGPASSETRSAVEFRKNNKCYTCALGSMFCSLVESGLEKDVSAISAVSENTVYDALGKYFSNTELADIETSFEGDVWERRAEATVVTGEYWEKKQMAGWLKAKYPDDTNRLVAIMSNIVKNRGRIKWEQI